ncbi:6-phosphogluconolactonase [Paenibacillus agricola]|uniref:Glucosamine-6-phosphate deaminase n=1 Tax=Paenibacillus agricola TaxID=2716264 RepID=A0ABX0JF00_9BACL|nr:6-phosphogluconolactonase [Paenibacillus agricola]NHN33970.1 glucosamine-6-phosphate deaminase [Paenibacillus agricola]
MKVSVWKDSQELGEQAALYSAKVIKEKIEQNGKARIILSTGASQFDTLKALIALPLDWSKVEMFHLDEYVNLPISHPASFRKYLQERLVDLVPTMLNVHFVSGEGDVLKQIEQLTAEIRKAPIDLALIGIGENAHIAFNDPPADFDTKEAYIVVDLDEGCKKQQVGEGWFPSLAEVPNQAISMTVHQIMQSEVIVSSVPHRVKAKAIKDMIANDVTNLIPATMLKTHRNMALFLDEQSASEVDKDLLETIK